MSDFSKIRIESIASLNTEAMVIRSIATNLYNVGLDKLAAKLDQISSTIFTATQNLNDAISKDESEQFKQAQQSSINVLNATLAGIEIGKHKDIYFPDHYECSCGFKTENEDIYKRHTEENTQNQECIPADCGYCHLEKYCFDQKIKRLSTNCIKTFKMHQEKK